MRQSWTGLAFPLDLLANTGTIRGDWRIDGPKMTQYMQGRDL